MTNAIKSSFTDKTVYITISSLLFIDLGGLFCRAYNPQMLEQFACQILPYLKVSFLFIPYKMMTFASNGCALHSYEPTVSIISFMLKASIVLTIATIMASWIFIVPECFMPDYLKMARAEEFKTIEKNIENNGGIIGDMKDIIPTLFGLTLFCFYLSFRFFNSPNNFDTTLGGKLTEDLTCVTVFATYLLGIRCLLMWVTLYVCGIKNPK